MCIISVLDCRSTFAVTSQLSLTLISLYYFIPSCLNSGIRHNFFWPQGVVVMDAVSSFCKVHSSICALLLQYLVFFWFILSAAITIRFLWLDYILLKVRVCVFPTFVFSTWFWTHYSYKYLLGNDSSVLWKLRKQKGNRVKPNAMSGTFFYYFIQYSQ